MRTLALYVDNDMVLEISGLINEDGDYVNDANITATLVTAANVSVSGMTWPATLSYVAASDGVYRCTLDNGLSVVDGEYYIAQITASAGGAVAYWEAPCQAQIRRGV